MRIGFFTDAYFPQVNGVVTSVYETTRELGRIGHDVVIIAPSYPNYKDLKEDKVVRLSSVPLPIDKNLNIRLATPLPDKTLLSIYKDTFDIIHTHGGGTISLLGLELARLKKIPVVTTYHTLWSKYTHYLLKGAVKPKVVERVSRILCNRHTAIVAPSPKIKTELLSYGIIRPIFVIPSGINLERFRGSKEGMLRGRLGLKNEKILLFIGRLGLEKSVDFLIKAFGVIAKENKNSVLAIVGEGPEKNNLQNLAKELGVGEKVKFFVEKVDFDDMPFVYKDAYLLMFASSTETQGMVVLEALASGVPVIAVNDPVYEGVLKDKMNSLLVSNDIEQFANECLFLLDNPPYRDEISVGALKSVEKFSIHKTTLSLLNLYERLIV